MNILFFWCSASNDVTECHVKVVWHEIDFSFFTQCEQALIFVLEFVIKARYYEILKPVNVVKLTHFYWRKTKRKEYTVVDLNVYTCLEIHSCFLFHLFKIKLPEESVRKMFTD